MSNYFTEDDIRLLDKTVNVREKMIDALSEFAMPKKPSDVLAMVSVIESLDKTLLAKAKLRLDDSGNKTAQETQQMMRELLINLHRNNGKPSATLNSNVLPDTIEYDIHPDEMKKEIDDVSIKDFN
jgi:hypothetical protein